MIHQGNFKQILNAKMNRDRYKNLIYDYGLDINRILKNGVMIYYVKIIFNNSTYMTLLIIIHIKYQISRINIL